ncbi:MAG: hypothetical protein ACI4DR_05160 [Roseburia sp.]
MENKKFEEEYSLLEIAKYNVKHWPILLACILVCALLAGGYGYFNTEPEVVYYQNLNQVNGAYFVSEYDGTSITERMYDAQQVAYSHGTYEKFKETTGYTLSFEEYRKMFGYSNLVVTSVLNMFVGYPGTYGDISIETEEEALLLMRQLMDVQLTMYDTYMGEGSIRLLSEPFTSNYTQAAAETASTPKDLLMTTVKGGVAGGFLGLLIGIVAVSAVYLIGTVAKTAKEIEEKLQAPAIAFVGKKDRKEEFKKAILFLERKMEAPEIVCYIPFQENHADGGYDLAKAFAAMERNTLYVNLSLDAKGNEHSLSAYLFGACDLEEIRVETADGVDVISRNLTNEGGKELLSARRLADYLKKTKESYERVIINAPDVTKSSDAYGIAAYCDKVVLGCKRREITGTDLAKIGSAMENNEICLNGVIVYGN